MKIIFKRLGIIFLIILIFIGLLMFANFVLTPIGKKFNPTANIKSNSQLDKSKEISLQQVNNLGYTFYLGEIDNNNSVINDSFKTQITKIIYDAQFPKSLLNNISIVVVNSLALKPNQYINAQSVNLKIYNFDPTFLYEGGVYVQYTSGKDIIYINKEALKNMTLTEILTHELGHAIGNKLTDADWKKYYALRNIPTGTPRSSNNQLWNLSPNEDFAEVYKNTFTGIDVKTFYGILKPSYGEGIFEVACRNNQSQSCRREVMAHPEKYPEDYRYGTPYTTTVNQKTKDFIKEIVKRFNIVND